MQYPVSSHEFHKLTRQEQFELVIEHGQEVMERLYIFYIVKLFAIHDFYVEIWLHQITKELARIIVLSEDDVLEIYQKQLNISDLED